MKYCKDLTEEICGYIKSGLNQNDAQILANVSCETFHRWMKDKPEFYEAVKKALVHCKHKNISIIQKAADKSWQAAAWLLERKWQEEFSVRQKLEHYGSNGEPLTVRITHYGSKKPK